MQHNSIICRPVADKPNACVLYREMIVTSSVPRQLLYPVLLSRGVLRPSLPSILNNCSTCNFTFLCPSIFFFLNTRNLSDCTHHCMRISLQEVERQFFSSINIFIFINRFGLYSRGIYQNSLFYPKCTPIRGLTDITKLKKKYIYNFTVPILITFFFFNADT